MDRAVVAAAVGAAALAAALSGAAGDLALVFLYLIPLALGAACGWWSVATFPLMFLAAMGVGNEVAPTAWSGGDAVPLLLITFCLTAFAASVRQMGVLVRSAARQRHHAARS